MQTYLNAAETDTLARKRAGARLGWHLHLAACVLVNLFVCATRARRATP